MKERISDRLYKGANMVKVTNLTFDLVMPRNKNSVQITISLPLYIYTSPALLVQETVHSDIYSTSQ